MTGWWEWSFSELRHPGALLLLVPIAVLCVFECLARAPGAMTVSTGRVMARLVRSRRVLLQQLPPILRALGLALLVLAVARPMHGLVLRKDRANIIDIMLCVDVSGSMKAMDFRASGQRRNRLFVTKEAVRNFIQSRKEQTTDRYGLDRMGLILYAGYAWTQAPMTLDYAILERELELAEIDDQDPRKHGTAIGSALGLAVSKLRDSEARSRVIILLTDGLNNAGELDPLTAARLAEEYGIRVYTIGAGSEGRVYVPQQTIFGEQMVPASLPIDEDLLRLIAERTGGKFYRATDTESLQEAYAEINQLEATELEIGDYYEQEEAFPPFAVAGGLLVLGGAFLRRARFDPVP